MHNQALYGIYTVFFRLPEIPKDTAESNPLLRLNEHPKFSEINPDNVVTGCAKLSIEYDVCLGKQMEKLKGLICTNFFCGFKHLKFINNVRINYFRP